MISLDVHRHVGMGADEYDLFTVPAAGETSAWVSQWAATEGGEGGPAILSPPPYYKLTNGLEDTRRLNNLMAALVAEGGDNAVAACGTVEPHHGDAALPEIDRMARELGLKGVVWRHRAQGIYADHPVMYRFVARALDNGLVPMVHATLSTNETLWRYKKMADKFAGHRIIVLGALYEWDQKLEILAEPEAAPNLIYDTAQVTAPSIIEEMVEILGEHRLVFGSGFEYRPGAQALADSARPIQQAKLSEDARRKVMGETAAALFGLEAAVRETGMAK
jgi:predicted TIM-barrel fold metal-dependent hydrolase